MQPTTLIAENHICISRALFDEGMRSVESKAYKKSVYKLTGILVVIYLAVAVWLWLTDGSPIFLMGQSIFLAALLFWLLVMLPGTRRRSKYKAMSAGGNLIPERTICFYPDHIEVSANTGKVTTFSYSDIQNWQETENLFILHSQNHVSILLHKDGFITGDFNQIKELLSQSK